MRMHSRITLVCVFLFQYLPSNQASSVKFCKKENYEPLFCSRVSPTELEPACGKATKIKIGFKLFEQDRIVKFINDNRLELSKGETTFKGKKFPSAGDMMEISWSPDLEKAAQNYARFCTTNVSPYEKRRQEDNSEINEFVRYKFSSDIISETTLLEEILNNWKEKELEKMEPFATTDRDFKKNFVLTLYGKHQKVGCGKLSFKETEKSVWSYYVVCHFTPDGVSNSGFYSKGKGPCKDCPKKTKCAKKGEYKGSLCVYSGSSALEHHGIWIFLTAATSSLLLRINNL